MKDSSSFFSVEDGRLVWRREGELLTLEAWGESSIRVRATLNRELVDAPQALIGEPARVESSRAAIDARGAVLRRGRISASVGPHGRVCFSRSADGQALLEEVEWYPVHPPLLPKSREFRAWGGCSSGGSLYHMEVRFKAYEGERFYGLGQHRHGLLDQKGAVVELLQRNAEVSIPFLLSSRGYGFLWNNPAVGRVELGANGTRWVAEAAAQTDYLVTSGSYREILSEYADLTGHAPKLPEWAAGFWQCRLRYESQEELLAVAREYARRGVPLSVIVVDFFHWTRFGDWRWDSGRWPDPEAMISELQDMGVRLMVSVWPAVSPKSENAAVMKERGWLIETNHGPNLLYTFMDTYEERPFSVHMYDSTNPDAGEFVWRRVKESYYDKGVRVFWLDACEPEMSRIEPENLRFHAGPGLQVANIYPLMHERAFYRGMKGQGETEIINLCRSAWAGSQRFGAAVWSGDITSNWQTFRAQIKAGLNIMMSGIPWWTTDIGGFHGGHVGDPDFRELLVRWFQYGAFCPLFRLHGFREPAERDPTPRGAPNEIWSYGEDCCRIFTDYIFLRERLKPYVMEQMAEASRSGVPPMRPLFFDYPDDPGCCAVVDAFLFGPGVVVAPVVLPGARSRAVYLPAGTSWKNAWTGEAVPSGEEFEADAPLERIPVFFQAGCPLDLLSRQETS